MKGEQKNPILTVSDIRDCQSSLLSPKNKSKKLFFQLLCPTDFWDHLNEKSRVEVVEIVNVGFKDPKPSATLAALTQAVM